MIDRRYIAAGLALIAAVAVGFGAARFMDTGPAKAGEGGEETEAAASSDFVALKPTDAAAAGVLVTDPRRGGGADIILPGRVSLAADGLAAIGAPVSGTVERVHVAPGAAVAAGAAIATVRSAEGATSRASVDASAAASRAAQAAAARDRRLLEAGVVARQDWEASQANAEKAQADYRAAVAQVRAQGQPGANGVAVIRSPIGGVVTRVQVQVGGFLTQGALVAEVADQSRAEYVFDVPAAGVSAIRQGQAVQVQTPDGQQTTAVVTAVAPGASGASAGVVRARPTGAVPPIGAVISARVVMSQGTGAITVPSEAVQTLSGRTVVFVLEAKGFRARPVTSGRAAGGYTEILNGLDGRERIAGKGAFLLKAELAKGEGAED